VGLEFDGAGAGGSCSVDEGVGHAKAALVRLCDLGEDEAPAIGENA
jgi:hypothetical protein